MNQEIPNFINYAVGAIGAIFFTFLGIYWGTNRLLAHWLLFFGLVCILLVTFMYWHNDIQRNAKSDKNNSLSNSIHDSSSSLDTIIDKPFLEEKPMPSKKSDKGKKITISDSPGSIATIDQEGDNIIINPKVDIPEPQLEFSILSENIPTDGHFKSEALLAIDSKTPINNLYLEARAPSIISFKIRPQRAGIHMSGHSGNREGFSFTNVPNAWGKYKLTLISKNPDKFEIIYKCK